MKLNVRYMDSNVGFLESTSDQGIVFTYAHDAVAPISVSMPDLKRVYREKECLPFFEGLLPEGEIRRQIADFAHVSSTSVIRLLDKYGADIAGALVITNDDSSNDEESGYSEISEDEICRKIAQKNRIPIIFSGKSIRLSLAGAENKVPVLFREGKYYLPLGKSASSHIIKATDEFVDNEFICNRLAFYCGLKVPEMNVVDFCGKTALLIKRYDRTVSEDGLVSRLHQEDFCQALGVVSENKYEENGGPGLKTSIGLIQKSSDDPVNDLRGFLSSLVFNFIIGNCDAHAKNFSLLYDINLKKKHLAPFYDVVCSSIYEQFDNSLAMKIGKKRDLSRIVYSDFLSIASKKLISDIIDELISVFPTAVEKVENESNDKMDQLIERIVSDSQSRISRLSIR